MATHIITFFLSVLTTMALMIGGSSNSVTAADLKLGFYEPTCPSAERIVRDVVSRAVSRDPGTAAGLIRLHFHDCAVRGCDGSVLLDSAPGSKEEAEKDSPANPLLRGFEVIDEAKAKLESQCPKTVSCADILAFSARDSASLVGGISYSLPGGRRDGTVSLGSEVFDNIPQISFNDIEIEQFFKEKGLSLRDAVALSGAHSIGVAPCGAFLGRVFNNDSSMDPAFRSSLKTKCGNSDVVDLDLVTPNRLDIQFYKNLKQKRGLLATDQILASSNLTAKIVNEYVKNRAVWESDFAAAMVRMGSINVLTGDKGEIRSKCSVVN